MKKSIFCTALILLSSFTFCSCGGDDEDDDFEDVTDNGGKPDAEPEIKLVGRTVVYSETTQQNGNTNSMTLKLKFTSSSNYSITKDSWYYKWQNGAYRQFHYDETKTGTYSISGTTITMKGNYPYWNGSYSEKWSNDNWVLLYHGKYLTRDDQADPDEPTWCFQ